MTETLVQLTMQAEFVCDDCKTGNCRQCQGHCDCQHKEEAPF